MGLSRELWIQATSPILGFQRRLEAEPTMTASLGRLLLLRSPITFLGALLGYQSFTSAYHALRAFEGPMAQAIGAALPPDLSVGDLRAALLELPALPGTGHVVPWLVLAAPLGVLGLWLHDAVWDHGCLWILRGLRKPKSLKVSLAADAEALSAGVWGAALALLGWIPGLGCFLWLPLAAVGAWFWILRGFALAAWHGCPLWKGLAATILHVVLAVILFGAMILLCVVAMAGIL